MLKNFSGYSLPSIARKYVKEKLHSRGYINKRDILPLDFRELVDCPIEACRRANLSPFIVDVPLDRCRGFSLMSFPCTYSSCHPFIRTIKDFKSGIVKNYRGSKLEEYYKNFQPNSGAEYLGLPKEELHNIFSQSPLWVTEPWFGTPSMKEQERKVGVLHYEHKGIKDARIKSNKEWSFFGPLSYERGALEYERLVALAESISSRGYVRHDQVDGDVTGNLLVREEDFSILINAGQHRICALVADGYTKAPVRFKFYEHNLIRREEARMWPAVRHHLLTVDQAQAVFDRVFEGRQPYTYNLTTAS